MGKYLPTYIKIKDNLHKTNNNTQCVSNRITFYFPQNIKLSGI